MLIVIVEKILLIIMNLRKIVILFLIKSTINNQNQIFAKKINIINHVSHINLERH